MVCISLHWLLLLLMTLALSTRPLGPSWLWAPACGAHMVWERIRFNLPLQFSPAKTPHAHCLYLHPTHTLCAFPFLQITWFFQFLSPRHILAIFRQKKTSSCYMTNTDWFLLLMELPPCFCQGNVLLLLRDFSLAYSCNIIYGSCSQLFSFSPPLQFSVCCCFGGSCLQHKALHAHRPPLWYLTQWTCHQTCLRMWTVQILAIILKILISHWTILIWHIFNVPKCGEVGGRKKTIVQSRLQTQNLSSQAQYLNNSATPPLFALTAVVLKI